METREQSKTLSPEAREHAVRILPKHEGAHELQRTTITSIAPKIASRPPGRLGYGTPHKTANGSTFL